MMPAEQMPVATAEASTSPKAQQILHAAAEIFMEQGYGAASMDAIARAAGVSKATLYAHFSGKEELFAAIVGCECRRHTETLSAPDIDQSDVRATLTQIGRNFLDLLLSPRALAIYRIVVAEAPRFPELGRAYYASGPAVVLDRLAAYLHGVATRGLLAVPDPRRAAEQFVGMLRGPLHLRRLLGIAGEPPTDDIDRAVKSAVDVFLRAHAARD